MNLWCIRLLPRLSRSASRSGRAGPDIGCRTSFDRARAGWGWLSIPVLCLALLTGCAAQRQSGLSERVIEPPRRSTGDLVRAQADEAWADREDPERLLEAILLYKKVHQAEPGNREVLVRLARALYFYADGYLQRDEERLSRYDQGAYFGEKAMALNPAFKARIDAGTPVIDALSALGPEDLEAVYWTASNLGKWSKLKGVGAVLRNKALIQRMLETVNALDDRFYYAATSRYWGAFYAVAPAFAGGDLKKSREYFDKALRLAPDFFAIKVLMADTYASRVKDRALFERLLREVMAGDATKLKDVIPEQKVEQRKARDLLARADEIFAG